MPSQFATFLCTGARKLFPFLFSYSKGKKRTVNESMQTKIRDKKSEKKNFMCHNSSTIINQTFIHFFTMECFIMYIYIYPVFTFI